MKFFTDVFRSLLLTLGFHSLSDVMELPNPKFLIEGLIPDKCLGMIYGPSGVGKSFFILDLILSVAGNIKWNGFKTRRGLVVYVIGEGGSSIKLRFIAWLQKWNKLAAYLPCIVRINPVNLSDNRQVKSFIRDLKKINAKSRLPIEMVVFDTLARCAVGADENSNTAMGVVIANCERIQKSIDTTVILVHHTDKDGMRYRGASCVYGAMDVVIAIQRRGNKNDKQVLITVEKQKDGEELPPIKASLTTAPLRGRKLRDFSSCTVTYEGFADGAGANNDNLNDRQVAMLEFIESFGASGVVWDSVRDAMSKDIFGTRTSNKSDAKNALIEKGLIIKNGDYFVAVSCMSQGADPLKEAS